MERIFVKGSNDIINNIFWSSHTLTNKMGGFFINIYIYNAINYTSPFVLFLISYVNHIIHSSDRLHHYVVNTQTQFMISNGCVMWFVLCVHSLRVEAGDHYPNHIRHSSDYLHHYVVNTQTLRTSSLWLVMDVTCGLYYVFIPCWLRLVIITLIIFYIPRTIFITTWSILRHRGLSVCDW